jgi:hypothetical protein
MPLPQHDPLIYKHLLRSLVFGCAREYFKATHTLAPFFPTPTSFDTISTLTALHLKSNGYFPLFLKNYELDQNLEFFFNSFKFAFQHMPHLWVSGQFGMVFEHLWDCFHPKDSMSGFLRLFQLFFHIVKSHIPL